MPWTECVRARAQTVCVEDRRWNQYKICLKSDFAGYKEMRACRNGRPVGTRTPDLYRVKVAL
jgi:hypothetical protein